MVVTKTRFRSRLRNNEVMDWAARYLSQALPKDLEREDSIAKRFVPLVQRGGFPAQKEFLEVCRWKTPRSHWRCKRNEPGFIAEVTRTALSTPDERLRIEVLTLLDGVDWPTASVILHWFHHGRYPIIDFRALWSLGIDPAPKYTFEFWCAYRDYCRDLADHCHVTMRELDRALWQYSKENQ